MCCLWDGPALEVVLIVLTLLQNEADDDARQFALGFSPLVPSFQVRMPWHQHWMVLNLSTLIPVDTYAWEAIIVGRQCRQSCRWYLSNIPPGGEVGGGWTVAWSKGIWGGRVKVWQTGRAFWVSLESLITTRVVPKRGMQNLPSRTTWSPVQAVEPHASCWGRTGEVICIPPFGPPNLARHVHMYCILLETVSNSPFP